MNERTKRIVMSITGVILCGISVGMFKHAALGVDPFQCLMSGLDAMIPISFGTLYVIVNAILLLFSLLLDRTKIGIATFINLFLLGYIVEASKHVFASLFPSLSLAGSFVLFPAAIILLCISSSLYITADLGVSTYDALALVWSERQSRIPFSVCRIITDLICVISGMILLFSAGKTVSQVLGSVGIGTIITAFFMGPLVSWFSEHLARPLRYGTTVR